MIWMMGAAAVLVSGIKQEDWKLAEKYAPGRLRILDAAGNTVFRVSTGNGGGSVNSDGICWGSYTSEEGCATVTVLIDEEVEDKKAAVTDVMGSALLNLMTIEEGLLPVLEELRENEKTVGSVIRLMPDSDKSREDAASGKQDWTFTEIYQKLREARKSLDSAIKWMEETNPDGAVPF